jgi:hypothetical protein
MNGPDMTDQVQLLSRPINFAVVQLPERKFPGVVMQGDTLHSLVKEFEEMARLLDSGDAKELRARIRNVTEDLTEALQFYEKTCSERGIKLPYVG